MTLSAMLAPGVRAVHALQKRPQLYNDAPLPLTIVGRAGDRPVFADAIEAGDMICTIDAADWAAVFPADRPRKFDKVTAGGVPYTVQNSHAAPPDGDPVWFRLLLRGGSQ